MNSWFPPGAKWQRTYDLKGNRDDKTLGTEEGCAACHRWRRTRGCP